MEKNKIKEIKGLEVSNNIAVVGSSNCILKSSFGAKIDNYDDVVRFNRAKIIENIVDDTGEKETIRVCNWHVFGNLITSTTKHQSKDSNFIKNLKNNKIILLDDDFGVYKDINIHATSEKFIVDSGFRIKLKNIIERDTKIKTGGVPSVGLSFIYILVLNNIKPDIFGFGLNENDKTSHYWEIRNVNPSHNLKKEREILNFLESQNKIKIYL